MDSVNPYATPTAEVRDVVEDHEAPSLAGRGDRLAAAIVDTLLGFALYLPGLMVDSEASDDELMTMLPLLVMLFGFVLWAAITIVLVSQNGQTIGKKLVGIKVVRSDGSKATLGRIFWLRNVVNALFGLIPFYVLVDVLLIFGERRQCIHDLIADTIVVDA